MAGSYREKGITILVLALAIGGAIAAVAAVGSADEPTEPRVDDREVARALLRQFDPRRHERRQDVLVSPLPDGHEAVLTVDPGLQAHVEDIYASYEVPFGSVVAIEPATGRVLAYVSHSSANPEAGDLALDPTPPTASVFKVITGAALVDAGVDPETEVCYGGGFSRLEEADLEDDARRDRSCTTLSHAMGRSINTIFAKLADRNLEHDTLRRYAEAFGFGHALPFDVPTRPSPAEVPDDRLEFARTAAGFWHMHMSPLHAALIGATIANGGRMPRAAIVDRIVAADGRVVHRHEPEIYRAVVSERTARLTGEMMQRTVTHGTSRRTFHDNQGRPFLPGVSVAGKTGTLSGRDPYRGYTWWVGFAPTEAPTIALAALVVNTPRWRIKANYVAREALRYYLVERPRELERSPAGAEDAAEAAEAAEAADEG